MGSNASTPGRAINKRPSAEIRDSDSNQTKGALSTKALEERDLDEFNDPSQIHIPTEN